MDDDAQRYDDLALRAAGGDRAAFRELVLAVHDDLRAWIGWRVGAPEMIEDVLQETLIAAHRSLDTYRPQGSFRAWLRGIARNRCLMALRERRRQLSREQTGFELAFLDQAMADCDSADDQTEAWRLSALRACLHQLPGHALQLIEARYWRSEPLTSLVQRLGQPKGTIAARLHRIRKRLLACIEAKEPAA
ncbi:MAG: RNA polymerase sigma factor [Planctomycetota bacterium]